MCLLKSLLYMPLLNLRDLDSYRRVLGEGRRKEKRWRVKEKGGEGEEKRKMSPQFIGERGGK